jgi:alpha/beta superfamily hydrolase
MPAAHLCYEAIMEEERTSFCSGELTLEALIARPGSTVEHGAVICHPHPLYGGSMFNNVVESALEAMWRLGWATLRFNFRGVGGSEGAHGGGSGEVDDAVAAVHFLASELALAPRTIALAGYSFGAMAAMKAASSLSELSALILIALPLRMAAGDALNKMEVPVILAAGDFDDYCPPRQLEGLQRSLGSRAQLKIIGGADHFFGGYEAQLVEALEVMLRRI